MSNPTTPSADPSAIHLPTAPAPIAETTQPLPSSTTIQTGGGAAVEGDVSTNGGKFVGRDDHSVTIVVQTPEQAAQVEAQLRARSVAVFTRKPFEPETVLITAGTFWLGSDGDSEKEQPRHRLTLPDYRIGVYPVTNAQYAEFLKRTPKQMEPQGAKWFLRQPPKGKEQHPVVAVSWHDALAYCRWLSKETASAYRLPSEAEWEKAGRGVNGRRYPWGDEWLADCCNIAGSETTPVDTFPLGASMAGCFDLLGNVQEWVNTRWGDHLNQSDFPYPYQAEDGREETGPATLRAYRLHRGGSFKSQASEVYCSARGVSAADSAVLWRGFRVVMAC